MQRRLTKRRVSVLVAGCILAFFLLGLALLLQVVPRAQAATSTDAQQAPVALDTPAVNDPTMVALEKEKLSQQIIQLQDDNASSWTGNVTLVSTIVSALALIIAGIFGGVRWFQERSLEQERRSEERFLRVVEGLGGEREETRVGAAIMLRTFLQPGYERFYNQAYDLAAATLRVRGVSLTTGQTQAEPAPLTPLAQACIVVFRESFPLARDLAPRDPHYFNAAALQLDRAYLSGADLRSIWMPQADLQEAFLNRVDLAGALLTECVFAHAELKNANLSRSQLRRVNFTFADLSRADLSYTKLRKTNFTGAKLAGVDFSEAELPEANLSQTNIEQAKSLLNAKLYDVVGLTPEQRKACIAKGALMDRPVPSAEPPAQTQTPASETPAT